MIRRSSAGDLPSLAARTAVVAATVLAIAGLAALIVVASEVLLLVFAGLLLGVFLSSIADALVRVSGDLPPENRTN